MKIYSDRYTPLGGKDWKGKTTGYVRRRWIDRMFEIPKDVTVLWISLHTDADDCRVKVKLKSLDGVHGDGYPVVVTRRGSHAVWIQGRSLDKKFRPHVGKPLWLEVWYK